MKKFGSRSGIYLWITIEENQKRWFSWYFRGFLGSEIHGTEKMGGKFFQENVWIFRGRRSPNFSWSSGTRFKASFFFKKFRFELFEPRYKRKIEFDLIYQKQKNRKNKRNSIGYKRRNSCVRYVDLYYHQICSGQSFWLQSVGPQIWPTKEKI